MGGDRFGRTDLDRDAGGESAEQHMFLLSRIENFDVYVKPVRSNRLKILISK
jgi:hypothetical protein